MRETIGFLGIVLSLTFVGMQIRQSNLQARAAAYQAIGAELSEFHQFILSQPRLNQLWNEASTPERFTQWSLEDWRMIARSRVAMLRIAETVYLQVEEGLLSPEAMERLGGFAANTQVRGFACIWPWLRTSASPSLAAYIEESYPIQYDCPSTPALDSLSTNNVTRDAARALGR